jgi:hypothetical protein
MPLGIVVTLNNFSAVGLVDGASDRAIRKSRIAVCEITGTNWFRFPIASLLRPRDNKPDAPWYYRHFEQLLRRWTGRWRIGSSDPLFRIPREVVMWEFR